MNILYMHTHDSGRYLMPYGHLVPTPNLMEFAKESTLFRHCYCAGPTCSPSRAAMLTGAYPHVNGMMGLAQRGFGLNDYSRHMASYLSRQGYETVLSGIQHEGECGAQLGYDKVLIESEDRGQYLPDPEGFDLESAALTAEYIKSRASRDGNFFLSFGMINTHRDFPADRKGIRQEYITPPAVLYDTKENREDMAGYIASASIADRCVGIVLDAVKEAGLEEDTVIFFTTDHGIAFPRMKCNLYDTGTGVALIMKYPGNQTAGTAIDSLVSHVDIFPTLCELCGIEKPDWLQGVAFTGLLTGEKTKVRDEVFSEVNYHASYEPMRSIRTERYKLIRRYDYHNKVVPSNIDNGRSKRFLTDAGWLNRPTEREMLFDLYLDPMERENLVNHPEYQDVYCDLSHRLYNWMEETEDPLIHVIHRLPKPGGAEVNKLTCMHAEYADYE